MASGGGGGNGCDLIGLLYCFASLFVFGYIGWQNFSQMPEKTAAAKKWASPENGAVWAQGKCTVHSTGITDQGGCWHPGPKQEVQWWNWGQINRDPELPAHWSVCPGLHWCADEGGTCNDCVGGEVTYAASLFHGNYPYEVEGHGGADWSGEVVNEAVVRETLLNAKTPTSDNVTVRNVAGPLQCGHGDTMPFKVDPAPGRKKFCYCTPKGIVDLVKQKGPIHPSGQFCPALTNHAFLSEAKSIKRRRLRDFVSPKGLLKSTTQKWEFPEGYCRPENTANSFLNDLYLWNQEYNVYLNWALVEVSVPGSQATSTPKLRCAYEYGAPFVSREDTDEIKKIYKTWNSSVNMGQVDCYVRQGGACGMSSCAVAMKPPSELAENPPDFGPVTPVLFMLLGCCPYILCFVVICVLVVNGKKPDGAVAPGTTAPSAAGT